MTHWQLQRPPAAPHLARAASPRPHCAQRAEGGFRAIHIRSSQPKAAVRLPRRLPRFATARCPRRPAPPTREASRTKAWAAAALCPSRWWRSHL
eukprot:scaffold99945_cov60-Phaeocystis_antarctica.AAC.4